MEDEFQAEIWYAGGFAPYMIRLTGHDQYKLGMTLTERGARRRAQRMLKRARHRLAREGARKYAEFETVAVIR